MKILQFIRNVIFFSFIFNLFDYIRLVYYNSTYGLSEKYIHNPHILLKFTGISFTLFVLLYIIVYKLGEKNETDS